MELLLRGSDQRLRFAAPDVKISNGAFCLRVHPVVSLPSYHHPRRLARSTGRESPEHARNPQNAFRVPSLRQKPYFGLRVVSVFPIRSNGKNLVAATEEVADLSLFEPS